MTQLRKIYDERANRSTAVTIKADFHSKAVEVIFIAKLITFLPLYSQLHTADMRAYATQPGTPGSGDDVMLSPIRLPSNVAFFGSPTKS